MHFVRRARLVVHDHQAPASEFTISLKGIGVPRKLTLGQWLRNKREMANKTRQQLADAISVSYASIYSWETDHCRPKDDNLSAFCKALRASVREARSFA